MSKQLGSALMFVASLAAIVVAANRAPEPTDTLGGSRAPASFANEGAVPFRHTEKLHGPVDVSIELVGAAPAAAGDVFVLKGLISSAQHLENVEYRWALPASVELVSGQPRGTISVIDAQTVIAVELTMRARDDQNAQVHLLATARARGARFAETAQYNTTKQHEFTDSRTRLMKSTTASEAGATEELKVFH